MNVSPKGVGVFRGSAEERSDVHITWFSLGVPLNPHVLNVLRSSRAHLLLHHRPRYSLLDSW